MLDITVTTKGDKVVIEGLGRFRSALLGEAIRSGLERVAKGVQRGASELLSGKKEPAGGYPVPVRIGHLRRSLDWLKPGETKTGEAGTFTAGKHESVVYNST